MHHYVYYSFEEWGRGYIGVRSCECLPEEDTLYFGSYKDKSFNPSNKVILKTFSCREEANRAEIFLHQAYDVARNPYFANKANACSKGFALPGPRSEECKKKMRISALSRWLDHTTRERHLRGMREYWSNRPEKFRERTKALVQGGNKWREENREQMLINQKKATEAAKLKALKEPDKAKERAKKASEERNRKILENPEFDKLRLLSISKPVILITPCGQEIEFTSKKECALHLGVSLTCLQNKLEGKNSYKLKNFTIKYKDS